jgi:hypothetical protein
MDIARNVRQRDGKVIVQIHASLPGQNDTGKQTKKPYPQGQGQFFYDGGH